jgi:hypothetical protein
MFFIFVGCDFQELKRFPSLRSELSQAATEALEKMREESKKTCVRLVDMEASYFTVDFFRKLPQEVEKGGNPGASAMDRYTDGHLRRIGECFHKFFLFRHVVNVYVQWVEPDSEDGFLHMNRLEGHLQQKIIYCGPLFINGVYQPPNRMIVYRTLMLHKTNLEICSLNHVIYELKNPQCAGCALHHKIR